MVRDVLAEAMEEALVIAEEIGKAEMLDEDSVVTEKVSGSELDSDAVERG